LLSKSKSFSPQKIIVFTHNHDNASKVEHFLQNAAIPSQVLNECTNAIQINKILSDWQTATANFDSSNIGTDNKQCARVLICTDKIINFVNIRNATCIVHFDFPITKEILAKRLWFMRDNFKLYRKHFPSNESPMSHLAPDINDKPDDTDSDLLIQSQCTSFILLTKDEYKYSEGLMTYFLHVGIDEAKLPKLLTTMAKEKQATKEAMKIEKKICPFVKSYGKCVSPLKNCNNRHFLSVHEDRLRELSVGSDNKLLVPNEGLVKVFF
jgi:hypothetical protein